MVAHAHVIFDLQSLKIVMLDVGPSICPSSVMKAKQYILSTCFVNIWFIWLTPVTLIQKYAGSTPGQDLTKNRVWTLQQGP